MIADGQIWGLGGLAVKKPLSCTPAVKAGLASETRSLERLLEAATAAW